jgi:hypothetical protein
MDDYEIDEVVFNEQPSQTRQARTKQISKRKGKLVSKPTSFNYDGISDSDDSRFSQNEESVRQSESREEKKRNKVKEQLTQSQREKHQHWERERERVQDLTGDDDESPVRTFDGVVINKSTSIGAAQKMKKWKDGGLAIDGSDEPVDLTDSKPKQRRANTHHQSSLANLGNKRMLKKERQRHQQNRNQQESRSRGSDPLDVAIERQSGYANASEFRNRDNYNVTKQMGENKESMDLIFQNKHRFAHENAQKQYGEASMTSRPDRQRQHPIQQEKQKQKKLQLQRQQQPMAPIPRKQPKASIIHHLDDKQEQSNNNIFPGENHQLKDIEEFNNTPTEESPNPSSCSSGKRKQREKSYDQLEVVGSKHGARSRQRRGDTSSPVDVDTDDDLCGAERMEEDDILSSMQLCNTHLTHDDFCHLKTPKERRGRSNVTDTYDYDTQETNFESEVQNWMSPAADVGTAVSNNLGLVKKNNGGAGKKGKGVFVVCIAPSFCFIVGILASDYSLVHSYHLLEFKNAKTPINIGTHFRRNDLVNSDSDSDARATNRDKDDEWNMAAIKKTRSSNPTRKLLKSSGMAVQTPTPTSDGEWLNRRE